MNCIACKGTGIATVSVNKGGRRRVITADCNDCKGTGAAVYMPTNIRAEVCGKSYGAFDKLPYTNTAGKKCTCEVSWMGVAEGYMRSEHHYPEDHYPLKDILFTGKDVRTGATVCRPLWRSIDLKKKTELFTSNKVARI